MLRYLLSQIFGKDKLHKAAQKGDFARMRKHIAKGADVNAPGPQGATPLFFTANTGSVEAAKLLLDHGAKVNHTLPEGGQPLHSALLQRHLDLSLFLLDNGADIHKATVAGVRPLHLAALAGLTPVLGRLLREGADMHALTTQGQTVLYCALAGMSLNNSNDAGCVRMLFASGVDPRIGAAVMEENMEGFSDAAKLALRRELETLAGTTQDEAMRRFIAQHIGTMSGKRISPFAGELTQSDDPDLDDWWYSAPIAVPFWDGRKLPFVYVFSPVEDPDFITAADNAAANFCKLTREARLALTPLVDENCRMSVENTDYGPDTEALQQRWLGSPGSEDRTPLWNCLTSPETIYIQRRHRRDQDIYVHMGMDCEWEEEHGLQFVFRKGLHCTRVSQQDGWLTEADAFDLPDSEDKLLSMFGKKPKK